MKNLYRFLGTLALASVSSSGLSEGQNCDNLVRGMTCFEAGTVAKADQINQNFDALAAQMAELGKRLDQQTSFRPVLHQATGKSRTILSHDNKWTDFPDLSIRLDLKEKTAALIFYQAVMPRGGGTDSHLVTRLKIDEDLPLTTRSITGNTTYWSPSSMWFGELEEGSHTVKVQYRTPTGGPNDPGGSDWHSRVLNVITFGR